MGFLGGIFSGSAPGLSQSENTAGSVTSSETGAGVKNLNNASDFWNTILSGDQQAIGKLLAPQISDIQKRGNEQIQTESQFGNRSGGENAAAQANIDSQRQQVEQMIAKLTGQAAGQVGNLGATQLGFGLDANQQRGKFAQQKLENQQGGILGQLISGATGFGFDALTSGLSGKMGESGSGGSFFGGASPGEISYGAGGPAEAPTYTPDNTGLIQ